MWSILCYPNNYFLNMSLTKIINYFKIWLLSNKRWFLNENNKQILIALLPNINLKTWHYEFQKTNLRFCALACRRTHWNGTINHIRCSFLMLSLFFNFKIMGTILNHTNSCPKTCSQPSNGYDACGWLIYCCCNQAESKNLHTFDVYDCSINW